MLCSSRKNSYLPHGRSLEIPSMRGVLKAKCLEAMYETKPKFSEEEGCKTKNLLWGGKGGMDIFWNCTIITKKKCSIEKGKTVLSGQVGGGGGGGVLGHFWFNGK